MVKVLVLALALVASLLAAPIPASAEPPPNDDFENAAPLHPWSEFREDSGSTYEATRQPGEPLHAGVSSTHTAWFTYAAKRTHRVLVFYPQWWHQGIGLAVYTGSGLADLHEVTASAEAPTRVTWEAVKGQTYHVALAGVAADALSVLRPWWRLRNDDFADALPLRLPGVYRGNMIDATPEAADPVGWDMSVWWRLRVPRLTGVTVFAVPYPVGSGWCDEPPIYAYTGRRLSQLHRVSDQGHQARFMARAGVTYYVTAACSSTEGPAMAINLTVEGERIRGKTLRVIPDWKDRSVADVIERGLGVHVTAWYRAPVALRVQVSQRVAHALGLDNRVLTRRVRAHVSRDVGVFRVLKLKPAARAALLGKTSLDATLRVWVPGSTNAHDVRNVQVILRR